MGKELKTHINIKHAIVLYVDDTQHIVSINSLMKFMNIYKISTYCQLSITGRIIYKSML